MNNLTDTAILVKQMIYGFDTNEVQVNSTPDQYPEIFSSECLFLLILPGNMNLIRCNLIL